MSNPRHALHFAAALLPEGWAANVRVEMADGLIAAVSVDAAPADGDERHAIALPGLPNLHSHAFQRGMAGLGERRGGDGQDSFWSWREVMYRFLAKIEPGDLQAIAALAYAEMLESGFTRVGEFHYLHHGVDGRPYGNRAEMAVALAAAADETGIGLTLLPVYYAQAGFGGLPPGDGQWRFINDLDGYAQLHAASRKALSALSDANLGIAPHSLRAVTPEALSALVQMDAGAPIHIHIAEQQREVDDCVAWSGARPVAWLLANAAVDGRWCLVHATHIDDDEIAGIARSGAVVGLCPITEANLGDGLFPAPAYTALGGRYGLGSDSNVRIDAAEEIRLLEYGQRLQTQTRNVLASAVRTNTGAALFAAAVSGGAQALGVSAGIAAGQAADFFSLNADHPALIGRDGDALLDAWAFCAGRDAIDRVWRRGVAVVENGRHRQRTAINQRYAQTLRRLLG